MSRRIPPQPASSVAVTADATPRRRPNGMLIVVAAIVVLAGALVLSLLVLRSMNAAPRNSEAAVARDALADRLQADGLTPMAFDGGGGSNGGGTVLIPAFADGTAPPWALFSIEAPHQHHPRLRAEVLRVAAELGFTEPGTQYWEAESAGDRRLTIKTISSDWTGTSPNPAVTVTIQDRTPSS